MTRNYGSRKAKVIDASVNASENVRNRTCVVAASRKEICSFLILDFISGKPMDSYDRRCTALLIGFWTHALMLRRPFILSCSLLSSLCDGLH